MFWQMWMHMCVCVLVCKLTSISIPYPRVKMAKRSKGDRSAEPWKREVELIFDTGSVSPLHSTVAILGGGGTGEKGRQLPREEVPGQTGNQQAAFWEDAGKVQTQCGGQSPPPPPTSASLPHLPSLTHLLTVWTVSSRRRVYIFFCRSPFIL